MLEPLGKNTAPAIALAAMYLVQKDEFGALLVLAADHVIGNTEAFCQSIKDAEPYIETDKLVTFGIVPKKPETGYGYIRCGKKDSKKGYIVDAFVEKPNLTMAKNYIASGCYLWNSGMFAFKAKKYLQELKKYRPDIYSACEKSLQNIIHDSNFIHIDEESFSSCPEDSIDYAVMEKTKDSIVIPMDANWSDVGSWSSLWDVSEKDKNSNVLKGDILTVNSQGNYIFAQQCLVATVGIKDTIVVQTKDAVLVADKKQIQNLKTIVSTLKKGNRSEYKLPYEVCYSWGKYTSIDRGIHYKINHINVKPKKKLLVQMHYYRSEHWIVVSGTAKVTIGNKEKLITENQSVYITLGTEYYLENIAEINLELIKVQIGSYLDEDDIIFFEDNHRKVE